MKEKIQQILNDNRRAPDWYAEAGYYDGYGDGWNDALTEVGPLILGVLDEQ